MLTLSAVSTADAPAKVATRLGGIEWARLICCIGIVWFHANAPGSSICYGGLPALMAISVALSIRPIEGEPLIQFTRKRFSRLMVPWLCWSAVYGAILVASAIGEGSDPLGRFTPSMLVVGTRLHLWFLPLAFAVTILIGGVSIYGLLPQWGSGAVWSLMISATLVTAATALDELRGATPLAQWAFVFPAVIVGAAIGALPHRHPDRLRGLAMILLAVVVGTLGATSIGRTGLTIPYLSGTVVVVMAYAIRGSAGRVVCWLSSLSFGVYLVHPLCAIIVKRTIDPHSHIENACIIIILSLLLSAALRHSPLRFSV